MTDGQPHRKRVRHWNEPGHVHELTFSCFQRRPLLTNDPWRAILAASIDRATEQQGYGLVAFVFMPEHVHMIVMPLSGAQPIDRLLWAIKRPVSYRVKQLLLESRSPLVDQLTVRQRPGVRSFRFWQEGPGYDRNLTSPSTVQAAIDYVHANPVRRGLTECEVDWRWSSARFHAGEPPLVEPDLPRLTPLTPTWLDQGRW